MYIIYCVIYPGRKSDVSSYPGRESDVSSVTEASKHPVKRKWPEVDVHGNCYKWGAGFSEGSVFYS